MRIGANPNSIEQGTPHAHSNDYIQEAATPQANPAPVNTTLAHTKEQQKCQEDYQDS